MAAMRLHHVQVSCPPGGEGVARAFYGDGLGMTEVAKPAELAKRGGAWFRSYDGNGTVVAELHVGVEDPMMAARKAHPAFQVADVAELEEVARRLASAGFGIDWSQRHNAGGLERFHTADGAGNRVEVLAVIS